MELKELETLRAIAELGSFGAAAQRLRVTQPAISQQLKKLEDELGETLVFRRRPKAELTEAGMRVLTTAERVFSEIESLREAFAPVTGRELSGVLRVTTSTLAMVYLYGDLLERFISRHPQIELIVTATENSTDAAHKVLSRTADIAFAAFPINLPNVATEPLGDTEYVLIAAPKHPICGNDAVRPEDIRSHAFIRFEEKAGTRMATDRIFQGANGYPPIVMESNDAEFIKRMVALGLGLAIVPGFAVRRELEEGRLKALRLLGAERIQPFGIVYRPDVRMRVVETFRGFCLERKIGSLRVFPAAAG